MDTASTISLIVGIVLSFSGVIFAILGANQKQVLMRIQQRVDGHADKIAYLEQRAAVRDSEIKQILTAVNEIKCMFKEHIRDDEERGR